MYLPYRAGTYRKEFLQFTLKFCTSVLFKMAVLCINPKDTGPPAQPYSTGLTKCSSKCLSQPCGGGTSNSNFE